MTNPLVRAENEQRLASNPGVSAFVSAHAGAGKTKLLIDRLLRLMLHGADPARILCLTFTKAAAAEMAIRLHDALGRLVSASPASLTEQLKSLGVTPDAAAQARARALFAHVLDLPGGMRISTIHAFCQSLLRRFPLEARLSPHFRLVEEADARDALDQAREQVLATIAPEAIAALAGLATAEGFGGLVAYLERNRDRLRPALALPAPALRAALRRTVGVAAETPEQLIAAAVTWPQEATLRHALQRAEIHGSPAVADRSARMLGWLNLPPELRREHFDQWRGDLFRKDGEPCAPSQFCNPALEKIHPDIKAAAVAEQNRILAVLQQIRALACADASAALLTLAAPVLAAYEAGKIRAGLLDYEDLIRRTNELLADPGAAWVKFKLDGGIDHLLLDEVQDTAALQWAVTDALTEDFFAGEGARDDTDRTIFAVGDRKQSIYGFQGADPEEFARHRKLYRDRVQGAGKPWQDTVLDVSFRSTAPILQCVDAVFARPQAAAGVRDDLASPPAGGGLRPPAPPTGVTPASLIGALPMSDAGVTPSRECVLRTTGVQGAKPPVAAGETQSSESTAADITHIVRRTGQAGSVTLWPLTPRPAPTDPLPWAVPETYTPRSSAPETLAADLATWIAGQTDGTSPLHSAGRPLRAGDILVLVRRRGSLDRALVRELKKRGVPVAGLDRMVLTEQPAVQDLMSLCEALLLPTDDLSLAEMLVSPLGGLTDESLMHLATARDGPLWDALRARAAERPDWQAASHFFATLLSRTDFVTPHALLSEALGPLGGRARLFARLGPEAAEPVDELLAASMHYAARHPPSLQGFLHWLGQSGTDIKREPEAAGDSVRIMTVHGAKGLEAPLVILPDTATLPPDDDRVHWTRDPQTGTELFLWAPRAELACDATQALKQKAAAGSAAEYNRLLYVALTRARDHLLVCGWQPRTDLPPQSWYTLVEAGLRDAGAVERPHPNGKSLYLSCEQTALPDRVTQATFLPAIARPAWLGAPPLWRPAPPPPEPVLPQPLAPSRPDDVLLGRVPAARSPLLRPAGGRVERGLLIHALLQHLPDMPPAERRAAARAFAAHARPEEADAIADCVLAVIDDPALSALFGPGSRAEQSLTGVVEGQVVTGRIDRLWIGAGRILVADYKTQRAAPATPDQVPVLYLRQLAAYRAVLRLLYPGHAIICVLVWTEGPVAMPIPGPLLDTHAPGAPRLGSAA